MTEEQIKIIFATLNKEQQQMVIELTRRLASRVGDALNQLANDFAEGIEGDMASLGEIDES